MTRYRRSKSFGSVAFVLACVVSLSAEAAEPPRLDLFVAPAVGFGAFEPGPGRHGLALDLGGSIGVWTDHFIVGFVGRNFFSSVWTSRHDSNLGLLGGLAQRVGPVRLELLLEVGAHSVDLGKTNADDQSLDPAHTVLWMPYASVSPAVTFFVPRGWYQIFVRLEPYGSYDFIHPTGVLHASGMDQKIQVGGFGAGLRVSVGVATDSASGQKPPQ